MQRDEPFEKNTAEYTKLTSKYAPHLAIYLYRKVKVIMKALFVDICGIPEKESNADWTETDTTENS